MTLFSNLFGGPKRPQLESDPDNFWPIERSALSPKFLDEMASGIYVAGSFKFESKAVLSRSSDQQGKPRFAVKSSKGNFVGLTLIRDNSDFENLFVAVAATSGNVKPVSEIGVHLTVEGDINSSETNVEWVQINWKLP
jgi:hypothetical protein